MTGRTQLAPWGVWQQGKPCGSSPSGWGVALPGAAGAWLGASFSAANGCISSSASQLMHSYKCRQRRSFPGEVQEEPRADALFPARTLRLPGELPGAAGEADATELRLPGGAHPRDKRAAGGRAMASLPGHRSAWLRTHAWQSPQHRLTWSGRSRRAEDHPVVAGPAPFLSQVSQSTGCASPAQPPALLTRHALGHGLSGKAQAVRTPSLPFLLLLLLLLLGREASVASQGSQLLSAGMCPLEIRVLPQEHLCVDPVGQKPAMGHSQLGGVVVVGDGALWHLGGGGGGEFSTPWRRSHVQGQPLPLVPACATAQLCPGLASTLLLLPWPCWLSSLGGLGRGWWSLTVADGSRLLHCHRCCFPFHHEPHSSLGFSLSTLLWFSTLLNSQSYYKLISSSILNKIKPRPERSAAPGPRHWHLPHSSLPPNLISPSQSTASPGKPQASLAAAPHPMSDAARRWLAKHTR